MPSSLRAEFDKRYRRVLKGKMTYCQLEDEMAAIRQRCGPFVTTIEASDGSVVESQELVEANEILGRDREV